jgi:hypothetical protein
MLQAGTAYTGDLAIPVPDQTQVPSSTCVGQWFIRPGKTCMKTASWSREAQHPARFQIKPAIA